MNRNNNYNNNVKYPNNYINNNRNNSYSNHQSLNNIQYQQYPQQYQQCTTFQPFQMPPHYFTQIPPPFPPPPSFPPYYQQMPPSIPQNNQFYNDNRPQLPPNQMFNSNKLPVNDSTKHYERIQSKNNTSNNNNNNNGSSSSNLNRIRNNTSSYEAKRTFELDRSSKRSYSHYDHSNRASSSNSISCNNNSNNIRDDRRNNNINNNKYPNRKRSRSNSRRTNNRIRSTSRSPSRNVRVKRDNNKPKIYESSSNDTDSNQSDTESKDNNQPEVFTVHTTFIPTYYCKDQQNPNEIKATNKLVELCSKFENSIIQRSRKAREKSNIPSELTQIPDYRQLLLTNKFDKFSRCKCDHSNEEKPDSRKCSQHRQSRDKTKRKSNASHSSKSSCSTDGRDSSSSSSCSSTSSSSSSSSNSTSSSFSSSSSSDSTQSKKSETKKEKNKDEFEDIRSMEIDRKQKHPERLHTDLSFNEPNQTNEGPLCKCKLKNTNFGTRHQIYYGEEPLKPCDGNKNNSDRLFHYRMTINPFKNFIFKDPTSIEYDNHTYVFEGFSIFSHEPLDNIPDCVVVIYNNEYKLNIIKEEMIENFTVKELELLKDFLFVEILELYDLKWKGYNVSDEHCNRFHLLPRFCRSLPYNGKEILSPSEILKYFLSNNKQVVSHTMLSECTKMSNREWLNYVEPMQGSIVTCPGKRPSSLRLDQLDRDQLMHLDQEKKSPSYPLIIHFSMFRNTWLPLLKNNSKIKKIYHKYFKLRHLLNNKTKPTIEDKTKLRALGDELQSMIRKASEVNKEIMIELSSENFYKTGIRTDMVQHAVLVPSFIEHLRFHLSLKFLEKKIGYQFKNRLLLQFALTHPSGAFLHHQNLGSNPDHVRNALFNCKVRNPNYGFLTPHKRKSLLRKKGIHMLFSIMSQKANENEQLSSISNYERLEFLGDKILELLTSRHLFLLFPMYDEGQLSEYRNAIVQNQYLAVLAKRLDLHYFIIFYHGVDLCSNSALNHALANSFEALLAAIYLDSDLNTVSSVLAKTLWDFEETRDLYSIWNDLPLHPIQAQLPNGDRHLIKNTKILQHVNLFEEMIGLEFKHIRLLAQAFCTRSASFNLITLGDNQRLEFLGDTVLNFVVSEYLYRFFPNHHEGHLSLLRSSLVCNSTQALLYDELGMSDFVLTSYINNRQETNCNLKRKADVFEAFVGALYLDQGLEAVNVFCSVCMFNKLQDIILYQFWNDPKSRLQQCCLSLRDVDDSKPSLPLYRLIEEKGPPNHKQYRVAVYFNRKRIGEGIGKSIHDAEVEAAKNALKTKADMFPILNKYGKNMELMKENLKKQVQ